jgi:hypothetical protein
VVCLPGFITNAGGVFGSSLYDNGLSRLEVETLTNRHVQPVICRLIELSQEIGMSPVELAERAAQKELDARSQGDSPRGIVPAVLRRLRRYLPKTVRKNQARQRFIAGLSALRADLESVARTGCRAAGGDRKRLGAACK